MIRFKTLTLAVAFLGLCALAGGAARADDAEARVASSRAAVKELFDALKGELEAAIKAGGPAKAIPVCNEKALPLTMALSEKKGWRVARTSLKVRNAANQPDAWEKGMLAKFEERKAAGENPAQMESHEVVEKDGAKVFRYMKAIPTAEQPCLLCHGTNIAPEVVAELDKLYPGDKARGFKAGDIRGAFTIEQPM